jgi:hypothetical protein
MYLYNITYNISEEVHEEWLRWMREIHIPEVVKEAQFSGAKLIQVLIDEDMGGITYSVQYQMSDKNLLDNYIKDKSQKFNSEMNKLFLNHYVSFSTELRVIDEF